MSVRILAHNHYQGHSASIFSFFGWLLSINDRRCAESLSRIKGRPRQAPILWFVHRSPISLSRTRFYYCKNIDDWFGLVACLRDTQLIARIGGASVRMSRFRCFFLPKCDPFIHHDLIWANTHWIECCEQREREWEKRMCFTYSLFCSFYLVRIDFMYPNDMSIALCASYDKVIRAGGHRLL